MVPFSGNQEKKEEKKSPDVKSGLIK